MSDLFALLLGLRATETARNREAPVVPEPEFKPFRLPSRTGATGPAPCAAARIPAANTALEARTLAELGVPQPMAAELEATFRMLGMTSGDRIVGYTFRTPDGASHALRAGPTAAKGEAGSDRAA